MEIEVFLPCRSGSKRVKNKNTKPFLHYKNGLIQNKVEQLLKSKLISQVLISSDDDIVLNISRKFQKQDSRIKIDNRPTHFASDITTTEDLIRYASNVLSKDHILWTHVTSPFINGADYDSAINIYKKNVLNSNEFDSLMSVNKLQTFLWNRNGPVNYDRSMSKWPFTQSIDPLYEVNSGIFIASLEIYKHVSDRIGEKPFLLELDHKKSFDIDWEEDFLMAEQMGTLFIKHPPENPISL